LRAKAALLTPGAGAGRDQASLVALDAALTERDLVVERMDFPYRKAGGKSPDRPPVLLAAVREGATNLASRAQTVPQGVLLGGRSMGGRICSMAVADGLGAAGLVLVSYPLHPPGKPEQLRTAHFGDIRVPCLFVSGTRDAFGRPDELVAATTTIPGDVTHVWVEGGDHGLRGKDHEVVEAVCMWLAQLASR